MALTGGQINLLVALILTELATTEADVTLAHKETVRAAVRRQLGAIQNVAYTGGMYPVKPPPEPVVAAEKATKCKKGQTAAGGSAASGAVASTEKKMASTEPRPAAGGGGSETKETMTAKVKAKGAEIAALKTEKGPKDAGIKPLLDELSALKAKYAEVAGEPWPVSAQQQKKSKKKKPPPAGAAAAGAPVVGVGKRVADLAAGVAAAEAQLTKLESGAPTAPLSSGFPAEMCWLRFGTQRVSTAG